jgi:hypothetical protein
MLSITTETPHIRLGSLALKEKETLLEDVTGAGTFVHQIASEGNTVGERETDSEEVWDGVTLGVFVCDTLCDTIVEGACDGVAESEAISEA